MEPIFTLIPLSLHGSCWCFIEVYWKDHKALCMPCVVPMRNPCSRSVPCDGGFCFSALCFVYVKFVSCAGFSRARKAERAKLNLPHVPELCIGRLAILSLELYRGLSHGLKGMYFPRILKNKQLRTLTPLRTCTHHTHRTFSVLLVAGLPFVVPHSSFGWRVRW